MSAKSESDTRRKPLASKSLPSLFVFLLLTFFLGACSTTYEKTAVKAWDLMSQGQAKQALADYEKNVTGDKERLLRLMDEGMLLRVDQNYEASNKRFLAAAKIIDQNGYLSLGEQATTLLTNEKMTTYQGEDFEKVLVHVYLALNFIQLQKWESALVEARRVNEILYQMISKGSRPYEFNAFSRYLTANLFEKDGDLNNAYVDYKKTKQELPALLSTFPTFRFDLMRIASQMGFRDDLQKYKEDFGAKTWSEFEVLKKGHYGSLLLLLETGKSPIKYSTKERHSKMGRGGSVIETLVPVAYYKKRDTYIDRARLLVAEKKMESMTFNHIEKVAMKHLSDRMGRIIAKALAVAAVKTGVGVAIGKATKSAELGILAGLGLMLLSDADTRSWLLLPEKLQIAKLYLPPGKHLVKIEYLRHSGRTVFSEMIADVEIKPNEITFLQRRTFK